MTFVVAVLDWATAITCVSPEIPPVAWPVAEIETIWMLPDRHAAFDVKSCIDPSLICAMAENAAVAPGAIVDGPLILTEVTTSIWVCPDGPDGLHPIVIAVITAKSIRVRMMPPSKESDEADAGNP